MFCNNHNKKIEFIVLNSSTNFDQRFLCQDCELSDNIEPIQDFISTACNYLHDQEIENNKFCQYLKDIEKQI